MQRSELNGFAVDLGGTKTAAAKIERGQIIARHVQPTDGGLDLAGYIRSIEQILRRVGWTGEKTCLGVTVTGRVSDTGDWAAVNSGTLREISGVPLANALRHQFGPQIAVSNDASATTYAEHQFGSGTGCDGFAYITVSTGVGGGLVLGGKLIQSRSGLAGHFGFSTISSGGPRCGSGRRGTVESLAGGRAVAQQAAEAGYPGHSAKDVFEAAQRHEAWAVTIADRAAGAIATLCANLKTMVDPDLIALGGSIGLSDGFIARVTEELEQKPVLFRCPVVPASLGGDGPLLGALAMAEERGVNESPDF